MAGESDSEYKHVRGLSRGLDVINAMNRLGHSTGAGELSAITGLHRTTIKRLLETLLEEGYVRKLESDGSYALSMKVRELSEGFRDDEWISAIAAPLLGELLQEVVWPTDLCTLDGDAMVVRETTHRFSRLSFHRSMVGRRLPLLSTATGRAYLAFCPEQERQQLLAMLADKVDAQAVGAASIASLLQRTRRQGYGGNFGEWESESRIASIALPVRGQQRLLGCLNLVYLAKAMPIRVAAERYLPAMRDVIGRIEEEAAPSSLQS